MARKPKEYTEEELRSQLEAAREKRNAAVKRASSAKAEEEKLQQQLNEILEKKRISRLTALEKALTESGYPVQSEEDITRIISKLTEGSFRS